MDRGKYGEILNYSWSPDSKWLAYDKNAENFFAVVHLYSLADNKITPVTTSMTNSYAPVFDPDGKYLYFLSDRDFNEVLGNVDFEFANPKTTRLYMVTLRKDETSPFLPLSDEAQIKKEEAKDEPITEPGNKGLDEAKGKKKESKPSDSDKSKEADKSKDKDKKDDKDKNKEKPVEFRIDLDGIEGQHPRPAHRTRRHQHLSGRQRLYLLLDHAYSGPLRAYPRRITRHPRLRSQRAQR